MKTIVGLFLVIVVALGIWCAYPYVWKAVGGTFYWGGKGVVYQGNLIVESKDNCSYSWTSEFHEVKEHCPTLEQNASIRTWVDGVEVSTEDI